MGLGLFGPGDGFGRIHVIPSAASAEWIMPVCGCPPARAPGGRPVPRLLPGLDPVAVLRRISACVPSLLRAATVGYDRAANVTSV